MTLRYALLAMLTPLPAAAQTLPEAQRGTIVAGIDKRAPQLESAARTIWGWSEVGYQEAKSSALLQGQLKAAGFTVKPGVAGMPTAFVASFKQGSGPVIGILAEYDALPGLAQSAVPSRAAIDNKAAGHGCGHNLFGAASIAAAVAIKEWMVANKVQGELRVYGSPAEEGGSGKVYLVRAGLFDDVSAVLHWHPADANGVFTGKSMANISGKFRFHGTSAHAAASPEKGRSALDGVEVMDVAVNFLREHIPSSTRIHNVITAGGEAPNVVPDFAESYYYVRNTDPEIVKDVWARVTRASEGAAMATGTRVEQEVTGGVYSMLASRTLAKVMAANLTQVGGENWTPEEIAWATAMQKNLPTQPPLDSVKRTDLADRGPDGGGSTDVSDISWTTPTIGLNTATWVPGTPAHSWQAVAASGMSIGFKGAVVAAKTIALTAADLFLSPQTLAAAKAELDAARGPGFRYAALLGDRQPALTYRKPTPAFEGKAAR
ncbi:amidohydrolase [Sphingomonas aracearum]|uniref:Amidohydrolase n=1 Tax=Sphingomonas aracearum TaxID=2283317 RepID=A0A369W134_9SPHN|nr:amidohydrolase [Sphingomonas aracearum]RDE06992.1 amidohydrolase [Sphingomonas aracearum]